MLNNPIQQIERTQDAYAGNPEGLQKRANMSKELIDLLAMQALQSDLAAQKRNMAMQQQGNPQTVKDQLEEGLMGEYRQEAAKDLGVNPSEGDVVERTGIAGQQMARNQQMAQGPQGMPQGGGGVASQAGPVNLAGGGIVSFAEGGPTKEDLANFLRKAAEESRASEKASPSSLEETPMQRKMREIVAAQAERRKDIPSLLGTKSELQERAEKRALEEQMEKMFTRETGGQQVGQMPSPLGVPASTTTLDADSPFLGLPAVLAPKQPNQPGVGVLRDGSLEDLAKPPTAVVPPAPSAPAIDPDAGIKAALEKSANLDPVAQAKARSEAVKDDLGLAEGIATLGDRKGRRERAYEETTASGMDNLIDLLTAGGRGGITGVGARSGQLRREENARRMAYEDTLDGIEDKTMTLRSTIGGKAATSYDNTMKTMLTVQQGAQNSLLNLSASEQKAVREERANNLAEARNGLLKEQVITGTFVDASTIGKYQTAASAALKVAIDSVDAEYATRISRAQSKVDQGEKGAEEALQALRSERAAAYENHPSYAVAVANQEQVDKFASQGAAERTAQQERILAADLINKKVGT